MATTYYADFDLGSGNNDGSSWTHAWKTLADAIAGTNSAAPVAGDTIYTRGTDTLAAGKTITMSGHVSNGWIKWIGCNAAGNNDGTRTIITANGGNFVPLTVSGNYNFFENWATTGSGNNHGWNIGSINAFVNCASYSNGASGFLATNLCEMVRCVAYSNTTVGFYISGYANRLYFCCSHDNTTDGYTGAGGAGLYGGLIGCVSYDNGDKGFEDFGNGMFMVNCVLDSNVSYGFDSVAAQTRINTMIGCRITNHSGAGDVGADFSSALSLYGWNAFDGNTDHIANSTLAIPITHDGTATNSELNEAGAGGGDTNQGYVSLVEGAEDYSTDYTSGTDPHLRRTAITIPTS